MAFPWKYALLWKNFFQKVLLRAVNYFFHRLPANILAFVMICNVRCCCPPWEWGFLGACAPHRASVQRSEIIYSSESLLWFVQRTRGIIEVGCGGSFRLVGWLTLGCWLAASMMTAWVCVGWPLVRLTECMQICRAGCLFGCFLIYWIWKDRVAQRLAEWMPMCVSSDSSGPQQRFMHIRCLEYHHQLAVLQQTRLLSFDKTSADVSQLSTPEPRCIYREYYSDDKI